MVQWFNNGIECLSFIQVFMWVLVNLFLINFVLYNYCNMLFWSGGLGVGVFFVVLKCYRNYDKFVYFFILSIYM